MNFFQKIAAVWRSVSLVQRALLISIVLTLIIVGVLLTHWARKPEMVLLYRDIAPEEAAKITEKISEKGITYQLQDGGTTIYAPKDKIYQLRLDMAKEGLPTGQQRGYKLFDDEKIGISPFVQNVNLQRALQEELAKSIQMIDGVVHARIHIVSPQKTLFTSQGSETSASVVLRLRPGFRLSAVNIAAITHLIAGGVEGLKSENVTVVDSQGRLLSRQADQTTNNGADTVADYRERVERNLADKVENMLCDVLGAGHATVEVSAVIDMTSVNLAKETYDESKRVAKKEEIKTTSKTEGDSAPEKGEKVVTGGKETGETIVTDYAVPKTILQQVELPGSVKSLSVAAVVDLSPPDSNAAGPGEPNATIMNLADVEKLIANALGLDLNGRDSLKVVQARFLRPTELLAEEEPSRWPRYMAIAQQASLGIVAVCALFVLRIFKGAKKKAVAASAAEQLPGAQGAVAFLPAGVGGVSESLMLRKQIAGALESNPEQVKQLFESWIQEKGR